MNEPRKKFKIVTDKSARVILPNTLTLIGVCIGLTSINLLEIKTLNLQQQLLYVQRLQMDWMEELQD